MSSISPGLQYLSNTERFYASKKCMAMYQTLRKGDERFHPFNTFVEIFVLGLAVGITTQSKEEGETKFDELLFVLETYTNHDRFGVFPLIMKSLYPDLDRPEIALMMQRYAEGGVRVLHEEYKRLQRIDFQGLLKLRTRS